MEHEKRYGVLIKKIARKKQVDIDVIDFMIKSTEAHLTAQPL